MAATPPATVPCAEPRRTDPPPPPLRKSAFAADRSALSPRAACAGIELTSVRNRTRRALRRRWFDPQTRVRVAHRGPRWRWRRRRRLRRRELGDDERRVLLLRQSPLRPSADVAHRERPSQQNVQRRRHHRPAHRGMVRGCVRHALVGRHGRATAAINRVKPSILWMCGSVVGVHGGGGHEQT
jgi:hypothetical protein